MKKHNINTHMHEISAKDEQRTAKQNNNKIISKKDRGKNFGGFVGSCALSLKIFWSFLVSVSVCKPFKFSTFAN